MALLDVALRKATAVRREIERAVALSGGVRGSRGGAGGGSAARDMAEVRAGLRQIDKSIKGSPADARRLL